MFGHILLNPFLLDWLLTSRLLKAYGSLRAGLILGHGLGGGACMGAWDVFGLSDSRPRELL